MTQEQRERLKFIAGRLEGIAYGVDNENICDAVMKCSEDIGEILVKDKQRPIVATKPDSLRCCKTCKHESLKPDERPCNDCWYGNGSDVDVNHWTPKEDSK